MKKYILSLFVLAIILNVNAQTAGTLTVTTTTAAPGGSYSPYNILAIWVQDSSGKFVKTLLAFANARKSDLTNWKAATPTYNVVDALTGATKSSHTTRTCTWNATNVSKVLVVDGTYNLKMELNDGKSALGTYSFVKSTTAQTIKATNVTGFSNTTIVWTPLASAIDDVKLGNLYSVYPNPTKADIYVSGTDIQGIEIFTVAGKSILKTNLQKLNLSALSRGAYLAEITTAKGTFVKKIIKE